MKVYQKIAMKLQAIANCTKTHNTEWYNQHKAELISIIERSMPSGSGIDCGTCLDLEKSNHDRITLTCAYHHLTEHGLYNGWTEHVIIIRPSLAHGIAIVVRGEDKNGVHDYLAELYYDHLTADMETISWH